MARLWSGGAELQSVTAGVETATNYGVAIDTTLKHGGAASWKLGNASIANGGTEGFDHQFTTVSNHVFARWYVYIDVLPSAGNVSLFLDLYSGATNVIALDIVNSAGIYTATPYYNNYGGSLTPFNLSAAAWHCVEIEYDSTPANGSEVFRVRLDGSVVAESTSLTFTAKTVNTISLGIYNGSGAAVTAGDAVAHIDDIAVNDTTGSFQTSWPGEGYIIHLRPNATGDIHTYGNQRTGGTAGDVNDYTRVNEVTPNDATSFNGGNTLNVEGLYNVDDSGIGTSDIVSLVHAGGRFRNNTADTAATARLEIRKTSGGTIAQSSDITPNSTAWRTNARTAPFVYPLTVYQDPDGAAWTKSTLDSMQIGCKLTAAPAVAGRRIDFTAVWALVEYVPASGTPWATNPSDAVTVSETVAKAINKQVVDNSTATDAVSKTLSRQSGDSAVATDTPTKTIIKVISDTVNAGDASTRTAGKGIGDNATATDVPNRTVIYTRNIPDSVTVTDAASKAISKQQTDNVAASDTTSPIIIKQVSPSDQVQASDTVSVRIVKNISDLVSSIDINARILTKVITDVAAPTDSVVKAVTHAVADNASTADSSSQSADNTYSFSDSVTASDNIIKTLVKHQSDAASSNDTISKSSRHSVTESVAISDTIRKSTTVAISESQPLTDSISKRLVRMESDSVVGADSSRRHVGLNRNETINVYDELFHTFTKLLHDNVITVEQCNIASYTLGLPWVFEDRIELFCENRRLELILNDQRFRLS